MMLDAVVLYCHGNIEEMGGNISVYSRIINKIIMITLFLKKQKFLKNDIFKIKEDLILNRIIS